ncbi:hypothetical protein CVD28_14720 [Bacillus sp. M6-12]|nr:hypothetical protein CVD28_14720 [Bacillus sp. M6-12]
MISGCLALYCYPLIINVGMVIGLVPITAVSLPFISYGTMSMLLNAMAVGIVLSVYR